MTRTFAISIFLVFLNGFFVFSPNTALGQTPPGQKSGTEASPKKPPGKKDSTAILTLRDIARCIKNLEAQIREKGKEHRADENEEQRNKIEAEIGKLNSQLVSCRKNFERIATDVELEKFEVISSQQEFDWKKEIEELLGPVIQELKSMTERPRQIEKLRTELAYQESKLRPVDEAVENIRELSARFRDKELRKNLEEIFRKATEQEIREKLEKEIRKELEEQLRTEMKMEMETGAETVTEEEIERRLVERIGKALPERIEKELPARLKKELADRLAEEKKLQDKLRQELEELEIAWNNKKQQIASQVTVTKYQLEEKLKEKRSFLESAHNILKRFFRSRGGNLLVSMLAFLCVLLMLRVFHRLVHNLSPIHRAGNRPFLVRVGDVTYHILSFFGAIVASLIVLYNSGDWVLLIMAVIFLLGLAWTARNGLPRFWEQTKLLLNLGAVRENEKVFYRGIPWRVVSVNVYSHLENPRLDVARIRLPIGDLIGLRSRPYDRREPWFPCKPNDWVILSDDTFGKVVSQTPEMVRLVLRGGGYKTYPTEAFLGLAPHNLSANFRLRVTFGVDYRHQSIATREVPEKLKEMLGEELAAGEYGEHLLSLRVEFKEAGASSLDLIILADFSGKVAEFHNRLGRLLQRIAVDACNRHGWVIPFTQITIHEEGV